MKMRSATATLFLCLPFTSQAATIAFWDFNDDFDFADEAPQIVHPATSGNGTLYQQRADTDGNGKGGVAYSNAAEGISASDGRAMAWDDVSKSGDNDAEFFIEISTAGFSNIMIRFDLEGNEDDGIISFDLKYNLDSPIDVTDPGDVVGIIKDFSGASISLLNNQAVTTASVPVVFEEETIDLSATTALNNQSVVTIRFDDFKENDTLSIDNILITGTPIPEPSSGVLFGLSILGLAFRRKR